MYFHVRVLKLNHDLISKVFKNNNLNCINAHILNVIYHTTCTT
jgi:hypothetical protein